jgi:hypothetical protein
MVSRGSPIVGVTREDGQASLVLLGVLAALLAGTLILFGLGQALGARAKHQRAADLAAISAAHVMHRNYARLFEPPFLEPDVSNPRHLEEGEYRELAVAAAVRGAERNGVRLRASDVSFGGTGFAPTRVTVRVRGAPRARRHRSPGRWPSANPGARDRRADARGGRRGSTGSRERWGL